MNMATNFCAGWCCELQLWIKQFHPQGQEHTLNLFPSEALKKILCSRTWWENSTLTPFTSVYSWPHFFFALTLWRCVTYTVLAVSFCSAIARSKSKSNATNSADSVTRDSAAALWHKNLQRYKRTLFRALEITGYRLYNLNILEFCLCHTQIKQYLPMLHLGIFWKRQTMKICQ